MFHGVKSYFGVANLLRSSGLFCASSAGTALTVTALNHNCLVSAPAATTPKVAEAKIEGQGVDPYVQATQSFVR